MKRIFTYSILVICVVLGNLCCSSDQLQAQGCVNADFSNGDFTGWTGTTSSGQCSGGLSRNGNCRCNLINPNYASGIIAGPPDAAVNSATEYYQVITTQAGGNDINLTNHGYNMPTVYPGNAYSARIGSMWQSVDYQRNNETGDGESISYSFVVSAENCNFTYHYAVVLYNGGHSPGEQPYFNISMTSATSGPVACGQYEVDATTAENIGGFMSSPDSVFWKPWSTVTVPLVNYIGQTITITFTTRGCVPCTFGSCCAGEHYAYAYIAAECSAANFGFTASSNTVCGGNDTLSAPPGFATYSWSGPGIAGPSNNQQVIITQPGKYTVNLTTFADNPCPFTLDTVINSTVIPPPVANFSAPTGGCSGDALNFQDLSTSTSGISSWQWSFGDGTSSNTQNPSHTFTTGGTFPVTLSVASGSCIGDTTISVTVGQPPTTSFTAQSPVCIYTNSNIVYTGNATSNATYTWNFDGGTGSALTGPGPFAVSWSTSGTKDVILTVGNGSCISAPDTVKVIVTPNLGMQLTPYTTICSGDSAILTATNCTSYQWAANHTLSNTDSSTVIAKPVVTTTYSVTGTNASCVSVDTVTVAVNSRPTSSFTATGPVCLFSNSTIVYTGGATNNATYNWNFDGGTGSLMTGPGPLTVNWSASGTKNIILTVANGVCISASDTVQVIVTSSLGMQLTPYTNICQGDSAILTATNCTSYQWAADPSLSNTDSSTVIAKPVATTTYSVTGTNASCVSVDTVTVAVNSRPTSSFTASGPVCLNSNSTIVYTGGASGRPVFTWSFDGGSADPSTGPGPLAVSWSTPGTKNVTLTVGAGICFSSPDTVPVVVSANAPVQVSPYTTICQGASATLTATNSTSYHWASDPSLSNTDSGTVVATPVVTTTYSVTGTSANCISSDTVTVAVNQHPTASFTATEPVCIGQTSTLTYTGNGNNTATYNWNFSGGTVASGTGSGPYTVSWPSPGNQYISLTVSSSGCDSTSIDTVSVYASPEHPTLTADTLSGCRDLNVCFTSSGVGNTTGYDWNFGDGDSSSVENPCHLYAAAGVYTVSFRVNLSAECTFDTTLTNLITVVASPVAAFEAGATVIQQPQSFISFTNQSKNASNYLWNFSLAGDSSVGTSTSLDDTFNFTNFGKYNVTLYAYNQLGCPDSVTKEVSVLPGENYFIPNAFTPNSDGRDDEFYISAQAGVTVLRFRVFNRWGEMVHDGTYPWDGTYRGKPVPEGVYIYLVDLHLIDLEMNVKSQGSVTLIR